MANYVEWDDIKPPGPTEKQKEYVYKLVDIGNFTDLYPEYKDRNDLDKKLSTMSVSEVSLFISELKNKNELEDASYRNDSSWDDAFCFVHYLN